MRGAFTLIEMIFTVVVASILALGSFKALGELYIRSAKAKAVTELSLRSQIVLDQLSVLLYNRIPNSVIGYNPDGTCKAISDVASNDNLTVLEWLALDEEQLLAGKYDGFVDMNASDKTNRTLDTPETNATLAYDRHNLIFAGSFDEGESTLGTCSGAYGWHGSASNLSFGIESVVQGSIVFAAGDVPSVIYEKFYLTNGGYAVTRGEDLKKADFQCLGFDASAIQDETFKNTLFLFYNFQPYEGETFCADSRGNRSGSVSILAEDVVAFRASYINNAIRLAIDMNRSIRGNPSSGVHVSKQKAVF